MRGSTARSVYSSGASTIPTLQRRIPKNPKYEHVEGVVDSGMNVRKVQNITTREYLKRKDELFKRVKPTSVYRLLVDHEEKQESIYDIGAPDTSRSGSGGGGFAALAAGAGDESKTGEAVHIVTHDAGDSVSEVERKPYLILDVRDEDDFAVCHVMEAVSFPAPRISQDRITPQLFSYKNKKDTMIIVYDDDEKIAAGVATLFVQKGWENIYMMSGGLRKAANMYPLMIDGELPERLISPIKPRTSSRLTTGSRSVRGGSVRGGASVSGASSVAGAGTRSIAGRSSSGRSRATARTSGTRRTASWK